MCIICASRKHSIPKISALGILILPFSHLSDPSHRETYESSHSVMLAIFASHAQKANEGKIAALSAQEPAFAEQIVPSYVQCLIDVSPVICEDDPILLTQSPPQNSRDGALNTTQLCMAYAALVRSAGAFGTSSGLSDNTPSQGDAFAWYCIEALLSVIHRSSDEPSSSKAIPLTAIDEHRHRLHLTLVATVPSVSLTLIPRLLDEVRSVIQNYPSSQIAQRDELIQALFKELSHNVGDAEKEYVMEWWYENRQQLLGSDADHSKLGMGSESDVTQSTLVSRL